MPPSTDLRHDPFHEPQLLKAIEIEGGMAKKILDDRDASITFFAPGKRSFVPPIE